MKILVTGSSSTIGKLIVHSLFNAGHTVIGVDTEISTPTTSSHIKYGIFVHYSVNICDTTAMSAIISRWLPDSVIHLADVGTNNDVCDYETYVTATIKLFENLNPTCRTFVFGNTSDKYTDVIRSHLEFGRESIDSWKCKLSHYANSKFSVQEFLRSNILNPHTNEKWSITQDAPTVFSLNVFQLMDAKSPNPECRTYMEDILAAYEKNKPFTVYTHKNIPFLRSYVSMRDVANAFVIAATKHFDRDMYYDLDICADTPVSGVDIYLQLKHGRGSYSPSIITDFNTVKFSPSFTELNTIALRATFMAPNIIGDNRLAKELLGWKPNTTLSDFIDRVR